MVIPSRPEFEQLGQSRQFRSAGGWESHPVAPLLDRSKNQHLLQISSDGYMHATTESTVTIEAGKQYEVSLIALSRNGGEAIYYLGVYGIGKDRRLPWAPLSTQHAATNCFDRPLPSPSRKVILSRKTNRFNRPLSGRNLLDNAAIKFCPSNRRGDDRRHLPLVETLDAEEKHAFIIRGYEISLSQTRVKQVRWKTAVRSLRTGSIHPQEPCQLYSVRSRRAGVGRW